MGRVHIDKNFRKNLEYFCRTKAKKMACEARERLSNHYVSLIDWYYVDYVPKLNRYDEPYYDRRFGLYDSYQRYYKNSHNSIYYGGVKINADKMRSYTSRAGGEFSAQSLLDKFVYNHEQTWHGGDWHGGYGTMANFSIFNEMDNYYDDLVNEYQDRCSIR